MLQRFQQTLSSQGSRDWGGGTAVKDQVVFGPFVSMVREALAVCIMPKYGEGLYAFFVDFRVWYYDMGFLGGPGESGPS